MKKKILILSILITTIGALSFIFFENKFSEEREEEEEESPGEPYENFMLERTYPNKVFDYKAYKTALKKAFTSFQLSKTSNATNTLSWTLEGPGNIGGRFNCIAVDPTNANIIYSGSANGGVWKTIDNGATWNPISDNIPYQAIGAIAINPSNSNEIWIGTGDLNISGTLYAGDGVYKSLDAGATWTYMGLAETYIVSSIIFNPTNTNEVIIGTMGNAFNKDNNRGIYKTTNGGTSFTSTLFVNDSTGIIDMVQNSTNPSILYASSFSRLRTNIQSIVNGTAVYVYKSIDFGQTWSILSGGLPNGPEHERIGLGISKSNPNIVYALYSTSNGSTPELYKTTDEGITWQAISISTFDINSYGYYGWYFGKIYVSPNDPNTIYIPGVDLQYSTDGGINWSMRTPSWSTYEVHGDGHFIHFNSASNFIYCTDGGLYKTVDGGNNWTDIENIPNNQFYSVTENPNNHGEYAGGVQDNGTMFGNAANINNFTRLYGGDGFTVEYSLNPSLVFAESQNGNIVYDASFNSGNWNSIDMDWGQNYNWHTPYFLSKHNQNTLFYAGQQVTRINNAPYGSFVTMSPILNDPNSPLRVSNISTINQSTIDSTILYAGTADGKVWNTLDYGNNWNDITPFQGSSYYVTKVMPSPNSINIAYVTRSGYRANDNTPLIFKTTNNGTNWVNISGNLPALAVNDIAVYPGNENTIFIANDAGVYYTNDAGINWNRLGNNLPFVATLDIHLNYNSSKLIAGTFGRSIYSIDVQSLTTNISTNANLSFELNLFPNPVTDWLTVQSSKKLELITIYSADGKMVLKSNSSKINVANLADGLYYIEIICEGNKRVKKIIKQ